MGSGIICEIVKVSTTRWWVDCLRRNNNHCAIYLDPAGRDIRVGDALWWQGGYAEWTPKVAGTHEYDARRGRVATLLKKIGFSGVSRPTTGGRDGE